MSEHPVGVRSITTDPDFVMPEVHADALRLDLACGQQKRKGFLGVDISGDADIVCDLSKFPWPFETSSVYEINCAHYIEHLGEILEIDTTDSSRGPQIKRKDALIAFMEEVYRILIPLGTANITGPYYASQRAWQDPTHRRPLTPLTMSYFDQVWLKLAKVDHYDIQCDFESVNKVLCFSPEYEPRAEEAKVWAATHEWNVVDDIMWVLRAHKPMRT